MSGRPRLLGLLLLCAMVFATSCQGEEDATVDDPDSSTSSSGPPTGTPCQAVRLGLERLRHTLGLPEDIDELKHMVVGALEQIEAAATDARRLTGPAARPVEEALAQAAANARSAVAAVAEANFGIARDELGQANDDVVRASDRLATACAESGSQ